MTSFSSSFERISKKRERNLKSAIAFLGKDAATHQLAQASGRLCAGGDKVFEDMVESLKVLNIFRLYSQTLIHLLDECFDFEIWRLFFGIYQISL